jgi:GTPase SAR1 family protein
MQGQALHRKLIDYLHAKDVGRYVELPQIAVMGDTSSGKSSLLTAISKVQFPSNDQITTRCPVRLRMEKSRDQTRIKVGIKWHASSAYRNEDAWPTKEFHSFDEISKTIEEAQQCILDYAKREVAQDIIEIEIRSSDSVDLTLIDLPGIVRSVGKGESESLVQDIAHLINEFLRNERCIILAVVPANVDFHNSQIMADAIKVDPKTCRTIPVITKPDLIDPGAEDAIKELLLGKKKEFALGFNMIRCRGQKALNDGVTVSQGLQQEENFFKSNYPWRDIEDRSLFGVDSLRDKLSSLQVKMIEDSVPSIMREVVQKKKAAAEELQRLGMDLSTDGLRRQFYNQVADGAVRFLEAEVMGKGQYRLEDGFEWRASLERRFSRFAEAVLRSRLATVALVAEGNPVYVRGANGEEARGVVYKLEDSLAYVDPAEANVTITQARRKLFFTDKERMTVPNGHHFQVDDRAVLSDKQPVKVHSLEGNTSCWVEPYRAIPLGDLRACDDWLEERVARSSSGDLPCFLSAAVFNSVVSDVVQADLAPLCRGFLEDCCDQVLGAILSHSNSILPYFLANCVCMYPPKASLIPVYALAGVVPRGPCNHSDCVWRPSQSPGLPQG